MSPAYSSGSETPIVVELDRCLRKMGLTLTSFSITHNMDDRGSKVQMDLEAAVVDHGQLELMYGT